MRRRTGFTLVELLVAFAAGGLLLAVVGGFLYYAGRPSRRAQARMANTAALSILEKRLQRDLSMAKGLPEALNDGKTLRFEVHPDGEFVEYSFVEGSGMFRRHGSEEPTRLRLNADLAVAFEIDPGPETTAIRARTTALRDNRTVEKSGERDERPDVLLELQVPNHVFDGKTAFKGMWKSPEPK